MRATAPAQAASPMSRPSQAATARASYGRSAGPSTTGGVVRFVIGERVLSGMSRARGSAVSAVAEQGALGLMPLVRAGTREFAPWVAWGFATQRSGAHHGEAELSRGRRPGGPAGSVSRASDRWVRASRLRPFERGDAGVRPLLSGEAVAQKRPRRAIVVDFPNPGGERAGDRAHITVAAGVLTRA